MSTRISGLVPAFALLAIGVAHAQPATTGGGGSMAYPNSLPSGQITTSAPTARDTGSMQTPAPAGGVTTSTPAHDAAGPHGAPRCSDARHPCAVRVRPRRRRRTRGPAEHGPRPVHGLRPGAGRHHAARCDDASRADAPCSHPSRRRPPQRACGDAGRDTCHARTCQVAFVEQRGTGCLRATRTQAPVPQPADQRRVCASSGC